MERREKAGTKGAHGGFSSASCASNFSFRNATVSALIWGAHESVMAVCSATVAIYYVVAPNPIGGRLLTWKPAVFIGAISYGMYMWHLICKNGVGIVWSKTIGGSPPSALILFALTLGAAILVSWISFKFYEKPFLRLKKYFG